MLLNLKNYKKKNNTLTKSHRTEQMHLLRLAFQFQDLNRRQKCGNVLEHKQKY